MSRRRPEKFTDANGTNAYTFPEYALEWEPQQDLRLVTSDMAGADYAYDNLSGFQSPQGLATEIVRFNLIEDDTADFNAELDALTSRLLANARGKLWTVQNAGERRWSWARLAAKPTLLLGATNVTWAEVVVEFRRFSDWYAEHATIVAETITSSPSMLVVPNPGNLTVRNAVIELAAHGPGGFQALTIENLSTGDSFGSSRVAESAQSRLRIDCGRRAVEYSNDGGATWTPDYGSFSWGAAQVDFMRFLAGSNSLRYAQSSGTPSADVQVRLYGAFS